MEAGIEKQKRVIHLMAYFELHRGQYMSSNDEGLCKHYLGIYTGMVSVNTALSPVLVSMFKAGLLNRKPIKSKARYNSVFHKRKSYLYGFKELQ